VSAPETLRVGDLAFELDGADLVDLRWGGLDLASRIQVSVRDPSWGTVPPSLRSRTVERVGAEVHVEMEAAHEPVGFAWRAAIDADEDGGLVFALEGHAERTFEFRRIGVCVLHPWRAYVGATYEATTPNGPRTGIFPARIAPQARRDGHYQAMIEAFSHLRVDFPTGARLEIDLDGELFELEDQRNWTDGSFKTYPTPLARSEPRQIQAGEHVRQRAVLRFEGSAPRVADVGPPGVRIGRPAQARVPPIGTSLGSEPFAAAAHTRVEIAAEEPGASALARARGPVELALFVDPASPDVSRVTPSLADVRLARVLVLRTDEETSSGELVEEVRARLGAPVAGVPVLGGTATYFSELNRNPPEPGALEGVAFAISPQVHAEDERSLRETLEIQTQVLRQARELIGGRPVHVSPVRLTAHPGTAFAEAWTVGSLATLIGAGAASITIDASAGAAGAVAALRGVRVLGLEVSDPRRLAALGVEDDRGRRLLAVNLTGEPLPLVVDGREREPLAPYEVRVSEEPEEATASS
jgi:hypothetical protein